MELFRAWLARFFNSWCWILDGILDAECRPDWRHCGGYSYQCRTILRGHFDAMVWGVADPYTDRWNDLGSCWSDPRAGYYRIKSFGPAVDWIDEGVAD